MEGGVMDYEFEMEKPFILTTADMLEIAASGGNGSEYVDIVGLMENAAKELREKDAEIEWLRDALQKIKKRNPFHNVSPPMDKQYYAQVIVEMVTIANAALKEGE